MGKSKKVSYSLSFASFICFLLALGLIVLLRVFASPSFLSWYNRYTGTLAAFEQSMQSYGATLISAVLILLNFALKAFVPWVPFSCICVVAGVLFKWYYALLINIVGMSIYFSLKFWWGRAFGAGNAEKILSHFEAVKDFINKKKFGSYFTLFLLRLFPIVPVGAVSRLYGTMELSFTSYLLLSVLGYIYKLCSYTIIGRNVFDPASASFIVPFILLLLFSGTTLLALSGAASLTYRIKDRQH